MYRFIFENSQLLNIYMNIFMPYKMIVQSKKATVNICIVLQFAENKISS